MDVLGWLSQRQADVSPGDEWLGERERRALASLFVPPRRASWRLGRWTAKVALAAWLEVSPQQIEVLAAADGAPDAWVNGRRAPVSVSISHRGDRALAVVAGAPSVAGCDLELIEPRSDAFIREWLAPAEQGMVLSREADQRALLANLIWTAKEAGAKVWREGLRLNVRRAIVSFAESEADPGPWHPLQVEWEDPAGRTTGWWRWEPGWVMAVAAEPEASAPRRLMPTANPDA